MDLTHDQLAAAEACGCTLAPATDDQVRRLTVQRRIFRIAGKPVVAVRDGFNETHATLAALIAERMRSVLAEPVEVEEARRASEGEASGDAADGHAATPAVDATESAAAVARAHGIDKPSKATRSPRPPRRGPAPEHSVPNAGREEEAAAQEAEEMLAEVAAAAQVSGPRARTVGRRRAGQPSTPRWMVAGKLRRGRLK